MTKETITIRETRNFITGSAEFIATLKIDILECETLEEIERTAESVSFKLPLNGFKAEKIVPCFSLNCSEAYGYYVSLSNRGKEFNINLLPIGIGSFKDIEYSSALDTFEIKENFSDLIITLHLNTDLLERHAWIFSVSCRSADERELTLPQIQEQLNLSVPRKTQMDIPFIGKRICSATCVSMLLEYYNRKNDLNDVAKLCYSKKCDLYGVWPAAIYAASHYAALGGLFFLKSAQEIITLLQSGYPLIASIRYGKGELTNCALERETTEAKGHLILVRGFEEGFILVNDPAAKNVAEVFRKYDINEFLKLWLERSAMAYVIQNLK